MQGNVVALGLRSFIYHRITRWSGRTGEDLLLVSIGVPSLLFVRWAIDDSESLQKFAFIMSEIVLTPRHTT